jgi:hypothetical protein
MNRPHFRTEEPAYTRPARRMKSGAGGIPAVGEEQLEETEKEERSMKK